jgi:hypothetical protein
MGLLAIDFYKSTRPGGEEVGGNDGLLRLRLNTSKTQKQCASYEVFLLTPTYQICRYALYHSYWHR